MRRLLPLLAFALLPVLAAAPVPQTAGRPTFGAGGLLSRAELEKVPFASRSANQKERLPVPPQAGELPDKATIAVHLPWTTFREGEPVPAYFVLRNGSDNDLALDGRLDLFGPRPDTWGSCVVGVFNAKTNERLPVCRSEGSGNGSDVMVVPANGFYCVRYDLGHTTAGAPLPPGEYEVEWRCTGLYSAPARFTITRREDGAKPDNVPKQDRVHFYRMAPAPDAERYPAKVGAPFLWDACRLDRAYAGDVFAALAVGHGGAYVPDLYALPDADRLVQASVQWKPYRDGDRVAVTLASRDPRAPVKFAERPHLYLHFRATGLGDLPDPADALPAEPVAPTTGEGLVTPLTIEVRLPPDWLESTGVHRSGRVAVLVTSGPLELPQERAKGPKKAARRVEGAWEGVLLTPFVDPRFPPEPIGGERASGGGTTPASP